MEGTIRRSSGDAACSHGATAAADQRLRDVVHVMCSVSPARDAGWSVDVSTLFGAYTHRYFGAEPYVYGPSDRRVVGGIAGTGVLPSAPPAKCDVLAKAPDLKSLSDLPSSARPTIYGVVAWGECLRDRSSGG